MSAKRYGPDETWPQHQKAHWRTALRQAREAGWSLTYLDAPHRFGVVSCPAWEHTFAVDKTARGGETVAKQVPKKLQTCPHGAGSSGAKQQDHEQRCRQLLETAETILDNVEHGLRQAEARQAAWDELERLQLLVETAGRTVEGVIDEEAAWAAAVETDDAPRPEAIETELAQAAVSADQAADVARRIRRPQIATPLKERAAGAQQRVAAFTERLAALREAEDADPG